MKKEGVSKMKGNNFFCFDYIFPMGNWWYPFHYENPPVNDLIDLKKEENFFTNLNIDSKHRSLYFHIPFCEGESCKFCVLPKKIASNKVEIENYVNLLIKEIKYKGKASFIKIPPVQAIFFGGGSPSILTIDQIKKIGKVLHETFDLSDLKEFSFEMNAKHVSEEKVVALKEIGVTHGRIGVQTFSPRYREKFGLTATLPQVKNSINLFKKHFKYSSIDLIYGMYDFTIEELIKDINSAISLSPDLIDYYPITNFLTSKKYMNQFKESDKNSGLSKIASNVLIKEILEANNYYPHNGHGFVKVQDKVIPGTITYRDYKFKYHDSLYGVKGNDIIGFGAFANSQIDGYIISNPPLTKYIENLEADIIDFYYVQYNERLLEERGVISHLPYFGYIKKNKLNMDFISENLLEKVNILKEKNLVVENENEFSLTKLGWYWYVNIFYYLMPEIDKKWILEFITEKNSSSFVEEWTSIEIFHNKNENKEGKECINLEENIS